VCGVCQESPEDPIQAGCKHIFCRDCIGRYVASASTDAVDCPVCFRCVLPAGERGVGPRSRADASSCAARGTGGLRHMSIDLAQPTWEPPPSKAKAGARQSILARIDIDKWRSRCGAALGGSTCAKGRSHTCRPGAAFWQVAGVRSTKIEALLEELTKLREAGDTTKSIVFSQFVNFLDLIEWRLQKAGFRCVKVAARVKQPCCGWA